MADKEINFQSFVPYIKAVCILVFGFILVKIIRKLLVKLLEKTHINPVAHKFLEHVLVFLIWIALILSAASSIGINIGSILTILAAAGAAVALSIQDSLTNLFGGVIVMVSSLLEKGDYISCNGTEGTVESIDLLHTTLITPDNKVVYIPNSSVSNSSIINFSKSETRRVEVKISISYEADSEHARYILVQFAQKDSRVLPDPQVSCNVSDYTENGVVLSLRVWVRTENYWDVAYYLKNNIKNVLVENGIEIPYPKMDVRLYKSDK